MSDHARNVLSIGMVLAGITAVDVVTVTAGPTRLFGAAPLSAQTDDEVEEQEFLEARRAINREEFELAAELFKALRTKHADGRYAADSYYWEGFARYRLGELREALAILETLLIGYPGAASTAEAHDLELRIRGQLAERGDSREAEQVLVRAQAALERPMLMLSRWNADTIGADTIGIDPTRTGPQPSRARQLSQWAGEANYRAANLRWRQSQVGWRLNEVGWRLNAMDYQFQFAGYGSSNVEEGCEEEAVQQAALQALMRLEAARTLPLVRSVLEREDECSVRLRKQAVFVLSRYDPAEVEELVIGVARNDPEPEVRELAVYWLGQVGTDGALDALSDILATSADPGMQRNAIRALWEYRLDRVADLLKAFALDRSKPERLRTQAILWFSRDPDRVDVESLIDLYSQLDSEDLKESVFFSLPQTDRATEWLLVRALETSEPVALRQQALFLAGRHASVDFPRLDELYSRLDDLEMKEQLIFLYSQRSEPEAVDHLIGIVRRETDPELRRRAIFWLGQTGSEKAIEFLLGLVGDPPR